MSIFDHPDDVPPPATWRCPHCGTQQPESSRCWACARSPMTCSTCLYYRRAVVSGMGFCGLDRSRAPLTGEEVRTCWQASDEVRALVPELDAPAATRGGPSQRSALPVAARPTPRVPPGPEPRRTPPPVARVATPMGPGARAALPSAAPGSTGSTAGAARSPSADGLIDAPTVPPARRLASEAARRARETRDVAVSGDDDVPGLGHHVTPAG